MVDATHRRKILVEAMGKARRIGWGTSDDMTPEEMYARVRQMTTLLDEAMRTESNYGLLEGWT